jgi:acetyl-CoA carboxylase biotin carboxyl carrier protein
MDALKDVSAWMQSTDLAEIAYRKDGDGFSLTAAGAEAAPPALPSGRFTPVVSAGVGVFQWSEPGKARKAEEGAHVAEGDVLGVVVTGSGAAKPILAPEAGRVSKILVDAGQAVEYGQPILFLEKR